MRLNVEIFNSRLSGSILLSLLKRLIRQSKQPTKLTPALDKVISQAVKGKISLEVIHQGKTFLERLAAFYNH